MGIKNDIINDQIKFPNLKYLYMFINTDNNVWSRTTWQTRKHSRDEVFQAMTVSRETKRDRIRNETIWRNMEADGAPDGVDGDDAVEVFGTCE